MRIIQIGAGLMGRERLEAVKELQRRGRAVEIAGIHDPRNPDAARIADDHRTRVFEGFDDLVNAGADWHFIAAPHDTAADMAEKILRAGRRVFMEKPVGRTLQEAERLTACAARPDHLWAGFNYRFFPGIQALLTDAGAGRFGPLISVVVSLGHGGNPDMKESWKLSPDRAGGGCLIDPGIHLIDLCRLLSPGKIEVVSVQAWKGFWSTGIEEECHLLLRAGDCMINAQVSLVRWRSTFALEVNGLDGYGRVTGRGRSYGRQKYVRGRRWGWLSNKTQEASEELVAECDGADVFADELDALLFPADSASQIRPCTARESLENMRILEGCRKRMVFA